MTTKLGTLCPWKFLPNQSMKIVAHSWKKDLETSGGDGLWICEKCSLTLWFKIKPCDDGMYFDNISRSFCSCEQMQINKIHSS